MAKKARIAMTTTDTEHATPIAIPRLMPGRAKSVSRAVSASVVVKFKAGIVGDGANVARVLGCSEHFTHTENVIGCGS
jgi:hypothetical protein